MEKYNCFCKVPLVVLIIACGYFGLCVAAVSKDEIIRALGRQIMEQQLFEQERVRSSGRSGIKQIRHDMSGTFPYYSNSHTRMEVAKIHDHGDNIRTVGVGEFVAVLNGVEFRTRHNDYRLYMPHRTSSQLHAMENIPFPDVPPEVTNKKTVDEQIVEMREWFRAFATQNKTHRDYTKYFKPALCYLEGAWYNAHDAIKETKWSDRHFLDADTYSQLQEMISFCSYTGTMKENENIAFLPRMMVGFENKTSSIPKFAQFSYRMLCQPLDRDVPLNRLQVVDELHVRVPYKRRLNQMYEHKATRFTVNPVDSDTWKDSHYRHGLLDKLMAQVPGLDNKMAKVSDNAYLTPTYEYENPYTSLNAGYYHRWYKAGYGSGSMIRSRGFSDDSLFVALNTQKTVTKLSLPICVGQGKTRRCEDMEQSVSFAVPFELIFMTPLSNWNPYNIQFYKINEDKRVTARGRNGDLTRSRAYNGASEKAFHRTPSEFFTGEKLGTGNYNKDHGDRGVLDANGKLRVVRQSGHHVFKDIAGIGRVRQRFPIMPIHGEGSTLWKELEALKQIVLKPKAYGYLYDGY